MSNKRVVITGIGMVSSIGVGNDPFWKELIKGTSGIKPITICDLREIEPQYSYEISDLDYEKYMGKRPSSYMDRATRFILVATKLALKNAKLDEHMSDIHSDVGIVTGTQYGCIHSNFEFHRAILLKGPANVNPMKFPGTLINAPSSMVSLFHKADAINTTISSGTAAGIDAIGYTCQMINDDRAKAIITSGLADVDLEDFFIVYSQKHRGYQLFPESLKDKEPIVKPFDKTSEGMIFGEGSAVLILEELEYAKIRNANILAEVLGYSSTYDKEAKSISLIEKTMAQALNDANINPDDIDYICANANGWPQGDEREVKAINNLFKNNDNIAVSSIKSMVGELCGGSGPTQVASTCFSIRDSIIPPTLNLSEPLDSIKFNVSNKIISKNIDLALINSFGYDGNNGSLVIGKYS